MRARATPIAGPRIPTTNGISSFVSTIERAAKNAAPDTVPRRVSIDARCRSRLRAWLAPEGSGSTRPAALIGVPKGPVAVVYPEAVWYSYVDDQDIDEIVQKHLIHGNIVTRLVLPADPA